tara:strand:+ start:910 stop:1242 length:333 start_codon:yes stop_codon:yes gene_type:complete
MTNSIYRNIRKTDAFTKILETHKVTIVKASASWCKPCQKIKPLVEKLVDLISDEIAFVPINDSSNLIHLLEISKLPTFILFHGYEMKERLESSNEDQIRKLFRTAETLNL